MDSEVPLKLLECHLSVIQSLILIQHYGVILAHASEKIAKLWERVVTKLHRLEP